MVWGTNFWECKKEMKTKNTKDDLIISHLEYIRTRVDQINGRVRENENQITKIKAIGFTFFTILTLAISLIGLIKWYKCF